MSPSLAIEARTMVKELLAATESSAEGLTRQWGPAALLFLPSWELVDRALLSMSARATVSAPGHQLIERALTLLRAFPNMQARFLPSAPTGQLVIGRAPGAAVMLSDASLSRSHAVIRWARGQYWLRDAGSLNGTYINAEAFTKERHLQDGDTIALGDAQLIFVTSATLHLQLQSLRSVSRG